MLFMFAGNTRCCRMWRTSIESVSREIITNNEIKHHQVLHSSCKIHQYKSSDKRIKVIFSLALLFFCFLLWFSFRFLCSFSIKSHQFFFISECVYENLIKNWNCKYQKREEIQMSKLVSISILCHSVQRESSCDVIDFMRLKVKRK